MALRSLVPGTVLSVAIVSHLSRLVMVAWSARLASDIGTVQDDFGFGSLPWCGWLGRVLASGEGALRSQGREAGPRSR